MGLLYAVDSWVVKVQKCSNVRERAFVNPLAQSFLPQFRAWVQLAGLSCKLARLGPARDCHGDHATATQACGRDGPRCGYFARS